MSARLLVLIAVSVALILPSPASERFDDPIAVTAPLFHSFLSSFEKARIETNLKGVVLHGDTHSDFATTEISEEGIYLNIAVRDPIEKRIDRITDLGHAKRRFLQFGDSKSSLAIEFTFGRNAPPRIVRSIEEILQRLRAD